MYSGRLPSVSDKTRARARELRKNQTDAERKLWSRLRNQQLGVKFRRQEPIGNYICDFYCKEAQLVVEVDGSQHTEPRQILRDVSRTIFLAELGFRVLRFTDSEVLKSLDAVAEVIYKAVGTPPLSPPQAGGNVGV